MRKLKGTVALDWSACAEIFAEVEGTVRVQSAGTIMLSMADSLFRLAS